jgi:type II restriction/modification system DNA methylase subunit YeeA
MLIIKNNLYGFEIDERASQLAGFAIMMKARSYHRRFFRNPIEPNILCFEDLRLSSDEIKKTIEQIDFHISDELNHDLLTMQQATNFGSLISPKTPKSELLTVLDVLKLHEDTKDIFLRERLEQIAKTISQLIPLCTKYHCVVDNPPYMGGGNMNKMLGDYVKLNYPDSKADLMASFMEAGLNVLHPDGFLGMINQQSWMFLSSYENLRQKLIDGVFFDTNLHLGARTFSEIGGEVVQNTAFTFWKRQHEGNGIFLRLIDFNDTEKKRNKTLESIFNPKCSWFYTINQKNFKKIPGSPIIYWLSEKIISLFESDTKISSFANCKSGMSTSNNNRFTKVWTEVNFNNIGVGLNNAKEVIDSGKKWIPYNKGGDYRKWYGNIELVVNWKNDGEEIKNAVVNNPNDPNTTHWSRRIYNTEFFYLEGATWSKIGSGGFSIRYLPPGCISDVGGCALFVKDKSQKHLYFILGLLNSKLSEYFVRSISPTLNFEIYQISNVPIPNIEIIDISSTIQNIIKIYEQEWNSHELSCNFLINELIREKGTDIIESYELYKQYWTLKVDTLRRDETDINKKLIGFYNLEDEVDSNVSISDICILSNELEFVNGELLFKSKDVFSQFMSYAVGCMFGRYSLDKEGLILANQGETLKDYLSKISKTKEELSFVPDKDNAIPILNDEWFEDDIVARFHVFLKASFGEANFHKNLAFVEECLGKNIRQYFSKEFYKDHIKRYKKRPIYWMFSSPKGYFNVLIYMHRYTPDTLSTILNGYLREFIGKLELQRNHQDHIRVSGSPSEQNKAQKEIDKINDMIADCRNYESEILLPLAGLRINIDLDDGVLVNYNKFGNAIALVDGLNDKKTKKKVMEFDWIDREQIR